MFMSSKDFFWPKDFPSNVPPDDSIVTSGVAFRLVKNDPPSESDFHGHNREPHKKKSTKLKPADYGTSMFRNLSKIEDAKFLFKAQKNKKIATGTLAEIHGKMS
jgi:hypothetical protein